VKTEEEGDDVEPIEEVAPVSEAEVAAPRSKRQRTE